MQSYVPMVVALAGLSLLACGAPERPESRPMMRTAPVHSTDASPACPKIDSQLVQQGRRIYTSAGNCAGCHGASGSGGSLGPNLTDSRWLNGNGSYESIAGLVRSGVARPRQFPAPMPPKGGGALSEQQVCAVAAYVYSLSH